MDICAKFENNIFSFLKNCSSGTVFLAAVSGGADSTAMLAALSAFLNNEVLYCVHVEHGLRPAEESRGDADFVSDFCKSLNINCRIVSVPPGRIASYAQRKGTGIEAAARFFRRKALFKEAARLGGKACILIAHTKNDMLETALMRVLRGAGPAGLAAMPVKRGRILRPMLSVTRAEVIDYLTAKKITWRDDSTNADEKFLRNRIRRQLVPLLNESFPSWETSLSAAANTQSLAADFITFEAQIRVKWEISSLKTKKNKFSIFTDAVNFFAQHMIIREEAVFQGVDLLKKNRNSSCRKAKKSSSVKRAVIRKFCTGTINAADLGLFKLMLEKGKIFLSLTQKEFFESGISTITRQ